MLIKYFYNQIVLVSAVTHKIVLNMSSVSKIAVCQLTVTNNKANNLSTVQRLVVEAKKKDVEVVFLPEACDYIGTNKDETKELSEPLDGDLMNEYKAIARQHSVWLSVGGFHERTKAPGAQGIKLCNAHVLLNNEGEIVSVYRKLHLYDVSIPEKNVNLKESDMVERGTELVPPVQTPIGSLALSICYDLRFPEPSVILRKLGAEILTFPSAFSHVTGEVHWRSLLKARAIENQCYVVAAAQYGRHNDSRISYGNSMVVDPWGTVLAECAPYIEGKSTDECVITAEIDLDLLKKVREQMPVLEHRRDDIYNLKLIKEPQIVDYRDFHFSDKVIPATTVFYVSNYSFAFTNIRCVVQGHVLVSSVRVAHRLQDLTTEELEDLFKTVVKVQKVLEKAYNTESSTVTIQDGKYAGQTIPHVHVHVLPRKKGDFENNDDIYGKLASHDRDNNTPLRSLEDRSKEAAQLRKYF